MRSGLLVGSGGAGNGERNRFFGIGEAEVRRGKVSDGPFEKAGVCFAGSVVLDVDVNQCVDFLPTMESVFGFTDKVDVGVEGNKVCESPPAIVVTPVGRVSSKSNILMGMDTSSSRS